MTNGAIDVGLLQAQYERVRAENERLKSGRGGGTSGGMDTVDAKIAAAEARTDTKFAELQGSIKLEFAELRGNLTHLQSAVDGKPGLWALVATVATGAAGIIGIILAVLAFGGDRFDAGLGLSGQQQAQEQHDAKQDEALQGIGAKLDRLIERTH
jgi:hypothetical protein